jgi:hypothetical protein
MPCEIMELGAEKSRHLYSVVERLTAEGFDVSIETVPHEFQRGANEMMRIASCRRMRGMSLL